jgi:hypothetical protein
VACQRGLAARAMARMGHSSPRAALIYLHGSDARQRAIPDGLNMLVEGELQGPIRERSNGDAEHDRARGGHAGKGRPS